MSKTGRLPRWACGISLALAAVLAYARSVAPEVPVNFADASAIAHGFPIAQGAPQYAQAQTASLYSSVAVVQPAHDSTVFDNAGNVEVAVATSPDLRSGDRIALVLDGRQRSVQQAARFKLSGIERGQHTLEARIVDDSGDTIIASKPVTFYLWQASRLFPSRRGK